MGQPKKGGVTMNTAWEAIQKALKGGHRTSEFFVAILAMILPYVTAPLFAHLDPIVQQFAAHAGWFGGLVAAMYIGGRSYVKGQTVKSETLYPAAIGHSIEYVPDDTSLASARAGEASGTPPKATGGNVGSYQSK